MKNWKAIVGVIVALAVIVTVLVINKKKLARSTSGGIQDVYYVSVVNAEKKNLSSTVTLTGTVIANNDVNIISETSGKVVANFTKVGDYKTAGSVLFQVDDELKKAALLSAEASWEKAKKDFDRFKSLYEQKSVSDAQFDQAKVAAAMAEAQYIVAKRQLEDTKIKTPISGYITARNVDVGSMVMAAPQATLVANVVDISRVKVKLSISESDAFVLKVGDPVKVTTEVIPGVAFAGRIESIGAKGDDAHTYPVEVTVTNQSAHQLKAGMFARAEFTSLRNREAIVIPREALVGSIKNPQVFVVEGGLAKIKSIVVGTETGTDIQVVGGLVQGEQIVVNGQNNIVDNTKVEILNK
jgi:RND family efflux transporter MFP subunit